MRSQIARIQEKARKDDIHRGAAILVGDRTRRRLFDEMASLSRYSDEPDYDLFHRLGGEISICGVYVRPQ